MTGMLGPPVNEPGPRSLTSIAVVKIRADVVRCVLKPGEKLRIQALCERYGVNASAIREALSRLVTDGLVEAVDQRGFRVSAVSREDLLDLTETRIGIESQALAKAIEIGDSDWEASVVAAYHRLSRSPLPPVDKAPGSTPSAWEILHRQFHETLLAGCGSRRLIDICRALYEKSERYRRLAEDYTEPRQRDLLTEHRALMEAALARDAALACRKLSVHFTMTTQIILDRIDASAGAARTKRKPSASGTHQKKNPRGGRARSVHM